MPTTGEWAEMTDPDGTKRKIRIKSIGSDGVKGETFTLKQPAHITSTHYSVEGRFAKLTVCLEYLPEKPALTRLYEPREW